MTTIWSDCCCRLAYGNVHWAKPRTGLNCSCTVQHEHEFGGHHPLTQFRDSVAWPQRISFSVAPSFSSPPTISLFLTVGKHTLRSSLWPWFCSPLPHVGKGGCQLTPLLVAWLEALARFLCWIQCWFYSLLIAHKRQSFSSLFIYFARPSSHLSACPPVCPSVQLSLCLSVAIP